MPTVVFSRFGTIWIAVALALRLGFVFMIGDRPLQTDEFGYHAMGIHLARHGVIGEKGQPGVAPPVPAAFFGAFFKIEDRLAWPRLGQAILSAVTAGLIGLMVADLTGSATAGRLALALAAIYPFFIYYSAALMSETLYLAFTVPGLWLLASSMTTGAGPIRPGAAGLLLALAALTRAEAAPIAFLMWIGGAAACAGRRWRWKALSAAVLCWSIPLGLWGLRNQKVTGHFLLDNHGGNTLLHGTMFFDLNEVDTELTVDALKRQPFYAEGEALDEVSRDRLYQRQALRFMRDNPGTILRQWARKFVNFWRFYPRLDKPFLQTTHSRPDAGLGKSPLVAVSLLFEPALILLGLAGLWALRGRWTSLWPLWAFGLATMAIHVVSVSQMRYRLALMPALMLGACFWLSRRLGLNPPPR